LGTSLKDFIYSFVRERDREHKHGERQAEGEAGSPVSKDSIPGPWDHDLSQRQMLN